MSGRKRKYNEDEVLSKASELFWKQGYCGTNARSLSQEMNMNLGSIYHGFRNKKDLFNQAFQNTTSQLLVSMESYIMNQSNIKEGIRGFYLAIAKSTNSTDNNKGCFIGNTIMESASADPDFMDLATAKVNGMKEILNRIIRIGKEKGQISNEKDEDLLSGYLVNLWHGLNVARRYSGGSEQLVRTIKFSLQVLD